MTKKIMCLASVVLLGLAMVSCNKDKMHQLVFTAGLENDVAKTQLNDLVLTWNNGGVGEEIMVNVDDAAATYRATSATPKVATFEYKEGATLAEGATYKVTYPATAYVSNGKIQLPTKQEYSETGMVGFPMYTETTSTTLHFKNLCAVLRLNLTKAGKSVRTITVTTTATGSNPAVSGNFDVAWNDGEPTLTASTNKNNYNFVVLDCGSTGVDISTEKAFHIYLPATTYGNIELRIMYTDGSVTTKKATNFQMVRNTRYYMTFVDSQLPTTITQGVFTVDANGNKVYFAPGNLFYDNGVWRFGKTQNERRTSHSSTVWDHFGWSTPKTTYGMSTSTADADYSGNFRDWGNAFTQNPLGWKTLTWQEWKYVIETRKVNGNKAAYAFAQVNNVQGLILLPDNWDGVPAGITTFLYANNNWNLASMNYSVNEWALFEAKGAIFLPVGGYRNGSSFSNTSGSSSTWYYWTSSPANTTTKATCITAHKANTGAVIDRFAYSESTRHTGYLVRLVRPVDAGISL